jgi:hypothetical protein
MASSVVWVICLLLVACWDGLHLQIKAHFAVDTIICNILYSILVSSKKIVTFELLLMILALCAIL